MTGFGRKKSGQKVKGDWFDTQMGLHMQDACKVADGAADAAIDAKKAEAKAQWREAADAGLIQGGKFFFGNRTRTFRKIHVRHLSLILGRPHLANRHTARMMTAVMLSNMQRRQLASRKSPAISGMALHRCLRTTILS